MNGFDYHMDLKSSSEGVRHNGFAGCPSGHNFGIQSDHKYYVLLCYVGSVFDEMLGEDMDFLSQYYFSQNYLCVSLWFRGEVVDQYLEGRRYLYSPTHKYYVLFNPNLMMEAKGMDGSFRIFYPARLTEPYYFLTNNDNSMQRYYKVFGNKAKEIKEVPNSDFMLGQYYGFVEREGKFEFIYAAALDIS